jgi:hypothetical protein
MLGKIEISYFLCENHHKSKGQFCRMVEAESLRVLVARIAGLPL